MDTTIFGNQQTDTLSLTINKFDSHDDLIKRTSYRYNSSKLLEESSLGWEYKYDQKGNWVEKTFFADDKAVITYFRKIEYYE